MKLSTAFKLLPLFFGTPVVAGGQSLRKTMNQDQKTHDEKRLRNAHTLIGSLARSTHSSTTTTVNSCNAFHSDVGCCSNECEAVICASDPFCCDTNWDTICAEAACGLGAICSDLPGACSASCLTPPPSSTNDLCENALPLSSFQMGSTLEATFDDVGFCGTSNFAPGVWYTVSGISGEITVDTCSSSSNYDTKISVFQGSCGGLICVDGNDDDSNCSINSLHSSVTWTATESEQYFILVHGFDSATGEFGLNAAFPPEPPTAGNCNAPNSGTGCCNTECEAAICALDPFCCDTNWDSICADAACGLGAICSGFPGACSDSCGGTAPNTNDLCENALTLGSFQTGSTASATLDNVGTCGSAANTAPGVWYTVSGISGPITVDTCSASSNYDTKISVFQGSCGSLTCVVGDDDTFGCSIGSNGLSSSVTWTAIESEQYFVLVHGFGFNTGEFGLNAVFGA